MAIFVYLVILRLDLHSFLGACENGAKMVIYLICCPWVGPTQLDVVAVQAAVLHKADKHNLCVSCGSFEERVDMLKNELSLCLTL